MQTNNNLFLSDSLLIFNLAEITHAVIFTIPEA